jgi:peptide chain release factor subunit 1
MHHFKLFAESLQILLNHDFEALLIGCRDETWPELEPHLHTYVKQKLMGRFLVDPGVASGDEVREMAEGILSRHIQTDQQNLIREIIGEAQRNARGAIGLRHVLNALERHEVQTLLVNRDFQAQAVECDNCRHLDTRMVKSCAVCGHPMHEISDVSDALVDMAIRNGAEIRFVDGDPELESAGRVGALLRFRADQNTPQKVAV